MVSGGIEYENPAPRSTPGRDSHIAAKDFVEEPLGVSGKEIRNPKSGEGGEVALVEQPFRITLFRP